MRLTCRQYAFSTMLVRVVSFGMLKESLGSDAIPIELHGDATIAELLACLGAQYPAIELRGIAVSVNAEYAKLEKVLREGDEVGLLPPVSGGASPHEEPSTSIAGEPTIHTELTREPINSAVLVAGAKQGSDGAVVVFDGIVRNHSRGRETLYLDYEAYEEMASKQMHELACEARGRFEVRCVIMIHRLGRLNVGETSVLIVVASAHRAQAFEANRWLIDTLKKKVPIWKKETFVDGSVWAAGEPFPAGIAVEASDVPSA